MNTTTSALSARAAELRRRLADQLEAEGDLRSPHWRGAVERVPRELFLGERIYRRVDAPGATLWQPITPQQAGPSGWLELAYENATWVTQLNSHHDGGGSGEAVQGAPTSSSTLPGLVVGMLEALQVEPGHTVMEIGTGTGYSTALLSERLGDQHVTSIEIDPAVADRAATALQAAGYAPTLVVGDGLAGCPGRAPYERIIATCSVRTVPAAWLAQTRPGGRILVTLSGWLFGSGLAAVEVTGDGHAAGRFLPGTISFMPARPHTPRPLTSFPARQGPKRPVTWGPGILADWMGRFLAQLAVPSAQNATVIDDDGVPTEVLVDQTDGSYAWLSEHDGTWMVQQGGPRRLWDQIEHTLDLWDGAGRPSQQEFTLRIAPQEQAVTLATPDGSRSWALPTS